MSVHESSHEDSHEEDINLKKTRKAFFVEYFCGFLLFGLAVFAFIKGSSIPPIALYLAIGVGFISLASAEISRNLVRYKITSDKVIITTGIIKKHKRNVYFHPLSFVPDINAHQSLLQRFFNYGTVFVRGGVENQLELRDINNPIKILNIIESHVNANRTLRTMKKKESSEHAEEAGE